MIRGLDSATPPSALQAAQAAAAGVKAWAGYLATRPGVNLAHAWSLADFDAVRSAGLQTWAYVSGLDDPVSCHSLAAKWGVRILLDVESGIRDDGTWVQPWLDVSGAGLYGNLPVFAGRTASCYVVAAYPAAGEQGQTWIPGAVRPPGPHGWQSEGTHSEFGVGVDSGWYDEWFTEEAIDDMQLIKCQGSLTNIDPAGAGAEYLVEAMPVAGGYVPFGSKRHLVSQADADSYPLPLVVVNQYQLDRCEMGAPIASGQYLQDAEVLGAALASALASLQQAASQQQTGGGLTAAQATELATAAAAVARMEAALKGA